MAKQKEETRILCDVFGQSHSTFRISNADFDDFSLQFVNSSSEASMSTHVVKASMLSDGDIVMWYLDEAETEDSSCPHSSLDSGRMENVLKSANDLPASSGGGFRSSFYSLIRLLVDNFGLPSCEPDIERVEAMLSEAVSVGKRRGAGDSGAGSEVSSVADPNDNVDMVEPEVEGDGDGVAGDAADEMLVDDDDIFKPITGSSGDAASSAAGGGSSSPSLASASGPFDLDMSDVADQDREVINKIMKRRFDNASKMGTATPSLPGSSNSGSSSKGGNVVAVHRLLRELNGIFRSKGYREHHFTVTPEESDLYQWTVKLYKIDPDSHLWRDLQRLKAKDNNTDCIEMIFYFNDNFPFTPPFVRLVYPVVTHGHVLSGGAICMELLTPDGWSSAYSIESTIMQISSTLTRGGARVNVNASRAEYSYHRAMNSFKHLVQYHKDHGWYTPPQKDG